MGCCSSNEAKPVGNQHSKLDQQQNNTTTANNNNNNNNTSSQQQQSKSKADAGSFPETTPTISSSATNNTTTTQQETLTKTADDTVGNSTNNNNTGNSAQKYEQPTTSSSSNETPGQQQSQEATATTTAQNANSNTENNTAASSATTTNKPAEPQQQQPTSSSTSQQQQQHQQTPSASNNYANSMFPLVCQNWRDAMEKHDEDKDNEHNFGSVFYKTLFEDYPTLSQTLFKNTEATAQRSALVKVLNAAIGLLPPAGQPVPSTLVETLQVLDARHVLYGTMPVHYPVVGANVIKTLGKVLGPDRFTEECKQQWLTLYSVISQTMIDAANSDRAAPYRARLHKKRAGEFKSILEKTFQQSRTRLPEFSRLVLTYIINGPETCVPINQTPPIGTPTSIGRESIFIDKDSELVGRLSDCFSISIADCINKEDNSPVKELAIEFVNYAVTERSFYHFTQDDKNTFPEALIAVLEFKKKAELSLYERMVIEWFMEPFLAGIGGEAVTTTRQERLGAAEGDSNNNNNNNNDNGNVGGMNRGSRRSSVGGEASEDKKRSPSGLGYPPLPTLSHVHDNWVKIRQTKGDGDDGFGNQFYKTLFAEHPGLHHTIFKDTPIEGQRMNLMRWLDRTLDLFFESKGEDFYNAIDLLGARHVLFGTQPSHYLIINSNAVETLKRLTPADEWNTDLEHEWRAVFELFSKRMIDASNSQLAVPYRAKFIQKRCREIERLLNCFSNPFDPKEFSSKVLAMIENETDCSSEVAVNLFSKCVSSSISDAISESNMHPVFLAGVAAGHDEYIRNVLGTASSSSVETTHTNISDRLTGCFITVLEMKTGKLSGYEKYVVEWFLEHVINGLMNQHQREYDLQEKFKHLGSSQSVREDQLAAYPLVLTSWKRCLDHCKEAEQSEGHGAFGRKFYDNVFSMKPVWKETLFRDASVNQGMNLAHSIDSVIGLLGDMPAAIDALRMLGARHVLYGVDASHYPTITQALIKTVKECDNTESEWTKECENEWNEFIGIISKSMIDASHSSKSFPHRRRLNHKRIKEFDAILKKVAAPFEPHQFACKVCSIAAGKTVPEGHPFATVLTPVFAAGLVESASQQSLEPILNAAMDAGKSESFDQFIIENAETFNSGNKMVAKKKVAMAVLAALQSYSSADGTQGETLTAYDEMVINFMINSAILKGLTRITIEEFDDLIKNKNQLLIVLNPGACVINCTEFALEHPGGEELIRENVGKDATMHFEEANHSELAREKTESLWIGNLTELDFETMNHRNSAS